MVNTRIAHCYKSLLTVFIVTIFWNSGYAEESVKAEIVLPITKFVIVAECPKLVCQFNLTNEVMSADGMIVARISTPAGFKKYQLHKDQINDMSKSLLKYFSAKSEVINTDSLPNDAEVVRFHATIYNDQISMTKHFSVRYGESLPAEGEEVIESIRRITKDHIPLNLLYKK